MNLKLLENTKVTVAITAFLVIALFAGLFFFILYPKMQEIPLKERELASQEQLLTALQGQVTNTNSTTFQSTVELQKMVPVKPLVQQLILDIEKAEVVSGSFVINMAFNDGDVTIIEETTEATEDVTDSEENVGEESETAAIETEPRETISLPTGVKKISVNLSVESPSYFEFEEFISILENSERIAVIEDIKFTAGEEIIDSEQTNKLLRYQVTLSAFYMPTLSDLIDSLPRMESPEPANKKNPFSKLGDYSRTTESSTESTPERNVTSSNDGDDDEEEEQTNAASEPSSSNSNTSQQYTVKVGDHLTKIAKQFYQSDFKKGIVQIKQENQLKSDVIRPGQVLTIPNLE